MSSFKPGAACTFAYTPYLSAVSSIPSLMPIKNGLSNPLTTAAIRMLLSFLAAVLVVVPAITSDDAATATNATLIERFSFKISS